MPDPQAQHPLESVRLVHGERDVAHRAASSEQTVGDLRRVQGKRELRVAQAGAGDEAPLNKDGNYTIKKPLPVGDYKVMVLPLSVREKADPKGPVVGVEKPAPDIPQKYRTIGSTDLKATVQEGKNDVKLDMKP